MKKSTVIILCIAFSVLTALAAGLEISAYHYYTKTPDYLYREIIDEIEKIDSDLAVHCYWDEDYGYTPPKPYLAFNIYSKSAKGGFFDIRTDTRTGIGTEKERELKKIQIAGKVKEVFDNYAEERPDYKLFRGIKFKVDIEWILVKQSFSMSNYYDYCVSGEGCHSLYEADKLIKLHIPTGECGNGRLFNEVSKAEVFHDLQAICYGGNYDEGLEEDLAKYKDLEYFFCENMSEEELFRLEEFMPECDFDIHWGD